MPNKKISSLTSATSLSSADLLLIVNEGRAKNVALSALKTFINSGDPSLSGSSSWNSVFTTVNSASAKWEGSYTTLNTVSAKGDSTYTTLNTISANIGSLSQISNNTVAVRLSSSGAIEFPVLPSNQRTGSGNNLKFNKSNYQKIISTETGTAAAPTVERLVIAGGDSYYNSDTSSFEGEAGDIYLWAGRGQNGGDIKIDAGYATQYEGGTIKIRGGNSDSGTGGSVEIRAGSGPSREYSADISLNTYGSTWTFSKMGYLQFPDGTNQTTSYLAGQHDVVVDAQTYTTTLYSLTGNVLYVRKQAGLTFEEGFSITITLAAPIIPGRTIFVRNECTETITLGYPDGQTTIANNTAKQVISINKPTGLTWFVL